MACMHTRAKVRREKNKCKIEWPDRKMVPRRKHAHTFTCTSKTYHVKTVNKNNENTVVHTSKHQHKIERTSATKTHAHTPTGKFGEIHTHSHTSNMEDVIHTHACWHAVQAKQVDGRKAPHTEINGGSYMRHLNVHTQQHTHTF
eukprot:GDKI01004379.1.p2 GENE.GDKI01004379.1~~GDKI01004379.1.p2  ORF type:complete len:144 (-),score=33.20 GDKI01004379.1:570-1001(-)